MNRRNFIFRSTTALSILPVTMALKCSGNESSEKKANTLVERVKQAVLTMQRASWEQGVTMQAFLESGDFETVYLMARDAVLHQKKDGRLASANAGWGSTDPASCGEGVLFSANRYNDEILRAGANKMLEYLLVTAPRSETGIIYHTTAAPSFWVDSYYMSPPFLAYAGRHLEAVRQVRGYREALWDGEVKLFGHQWDDQKKEFISKKNFWGVGNGWAVAGMTRVIRSLPETLPDEKAEIIGYVKAALDGCLAHIRPDGLFHNIVNDPSTFTETNLPQMLAYSIFRGVKAKWLDNSYLSYAEKMRNAVHEKVDQFGFVQDVCGAPFFNSPGVAAEGQAFFILMEAAYNDFVK